MDTNHQINLHTEIQYLKGVGPKTAAIILCFSFEALGLEEFNPSTRCEVEGKPEKLVRFDFAILDELGPPDYPKARKSIYLEENNIIKELVLFNVMDAITEDILILEYVEKNNNEHTNNIKSLLGIDPALIDPAILIKRDQYTPDIVFNDQI